MLRAIAILFSLWLLTACVTADTQANSRSEKLRNARAAVTPVMLGTGY
jgi:hypothetical protein